MYWFYFHVFDYILRNAKVKIPNITEYSIQTLKFRLIRVLKKNCIIMQFKS